MSRRLLTLALLIFALVVPAMADDESAIRSVIGKERFLAARAAGEWAVAFWAVPRTAGADGVTLLTSKGGRWTVVKEQNAWTRGGLLAAGVPDDALATLGYGDVPPALVSSLAYETSTLSPRPSHYRVATFGRSRFALTNGGDIWKGKQVVWQRIQEKWHPIFSYDGAKTQLEAREKRYAKEGLTLYMEILLNYEGEGGVLPAAP